MPMGLFHPTPKSYVGIDIGSAYIKMVELLNEKHRPRLSTYGYLALPLGGKDKMAFTSPKTRALLLKKIIQEAHIHSKNAVLSLPLASVFTTILHLPQVTKREFASPKNLAPLIYWEVKKLLPLPIEDMVLDWEIIQKQVENADHGVDEKKRFWQRAQYQDIEVFITAAPRDLIATYTETVKQSGLSLLHLESDVFGLVRSLVGQDPSTIMLVDIGAKVTNVSIVEKGIPYLNRTLDFGGFVFTRAITEKLGISLEEAEQFKCDLSLAERREFPREFENLMIDVVNEMNYVKRLFFEQYPGKHFEKVILTGGSSLLSGIAQVLSQRVNTRVYVGDPWARVLYPPELRPVLDRVGPMFSVAIGLAMRNIMN